MTVAGAIRRYGPLTLLLVVAVLLPATAFAQGPEPWVRGAFSVQDFLVIVFCPIAATALVIFGLVKLATGHHDSYGAIATSFAAAFGLMGITAYMSWFR